MWSLPIKSQTHMVPSICMPLLRCIIYDEWYSSNIYHWIAKKENQKIQWQCGQGEFIDLRIKRLCILQPQQEMQQLKRLLLHFYVTIFGHFKGIRPKKKNFRRLCKGKIQVFYTPNRKCNSWKGFCCIFMWQYLGILKEKGQKNFSRRLCKGKRQVFQAPTGYSTADKAFIAILCDNIWTF